MGIGRLPHGGHRLHRVQERRWPINLIKWIEPVRQRREDYQQQPQHVLDILDTGSKRARMVAQGTMDRVREAVFGWDKTRDEIRRKRRRRALDDVFARSEET